MSIHNLSLPLQTSPHNLSITSSTFFSGQTVLTLIPKFAHLSLTTTTTKPPTTIIRMGGGPRTYPGGVNKWQWKRMQSKKAKQLLKARLERERQIYEMRKRAELKAAVSELERPWEAVEKAPELFSESADEQVQVLADRFQRPGGFDLWSERDGPELFKTVDGLHSSRFFPKGVVHSVKPYGRVSDDSVDFGVDGENLGAGSFKEYVEKRNLAKVEKPNVSNEGRSGDDGKGKMRKKRHGRRVGANASDGVESRRVGFDEENGGIARALRKDGTSGRRMRKVEGANSDVYDMNLQRDGSYWFRERND